MPAKTLPGFRIVLFASIAGMAQLAIAQQGLVGPTPISQPAPLLTANAIGRPTEGWAVVRYSVLEDGTTASVRVVDIVPPGADPNPAIEAVRQWTFTPGTKNDEPIDWINNEAIVMFQSPTEDAEPSSVFQTRYTEIQEAIQTQIPTLDGPDRDEVIKAYESIRDASLELLREQATRLDDIALGLSQAMFIHIYLQDTHEAYEYARRATDPRHDLLDGEDLSAALQQRLQLEASLGRIRDALLTLERIHSGFGPSESTPAADFAEQLRNRAENDEVLKTLAYVGERPWRIDASRHIFTIGEIDGTIDSIDAECDSARIRLEYQADVDWRLPESLGACTYFVNAEPGTRFSFFELLPPEQ